MLTMDQIHDIRFRYYHKAENLNEIAKATNCDWKTVRKYVDMEDFNPPTPKSPADYRLCPKLDPFKNTIDEWLHEDLQAPRKQRHTARRVHQRLKDKFKESYNCSYRTVASYLAVRKPEIFGVQPDSALPLEHKPSEAQVDFGKAQFYENGKKHEGSYLEVTFPYSNKGYLQLFYGENLECLLEGLVAIFKHINGVPRELWFDNTKTIVTKILKGGGRELTERFKHFQMHYGFEAIFTNPGKGNEKGCVENKVGYHRRNLLVPVPRFIELDLYNQQLLERCETDAEREHYRKNDDIHQLFQEDLKYNLALPSIPFETSRLKTVTVNAWGKFSLNKGLHTYSTAPKYANSKVQIRLSSKTVTILDESHRDVVVHRRMYGDLKQESMEWIPYLKQLSIRPRALKYSGVYDLMPPVMQTYLQETSNTETGKVLKLLAELTARSGFESALNTIEHAITYQATNADSLKNLYRRLYLDVPELPPMKLSGSIQSLEPMAPRLSEYDALLQQGRDLDA